MQFQVDDHTCAFFALEVDRQLVMQSEVMGLGDLSPAGSASAVKLLHGLNWAARESTGIVAMIDPREKVVVSKTLEMRQLNAQSMGSEIAALLSAAVNLGTVLKSSADASATAEHAKAASSLDLRFS